LTGRWMRGDGMIRQRAGARILVLPQRAYLPNGTLRDAVAYPSRPDAFGDAAVDAALDAVCLGSLAHRAGEQADWSAKLSNGEQQLIGMARVLLNQPDVLLIDEATSALETERETELLLLLRARFPKMAILWATHRQPGSQTYNRRLSLDRDEPARTWELTDNRALV
jgi:vitamin B12/bleomycin/antimicrobial peptide transport system ATP-binding/permease protein